MIDAGLMSKAPWAGWNIERLRLRKRQGVAQVDERGASRAELVAMGAVDVEIGACPFVEVGARFIGIGQMRFGPRVQSGRTLAFAVHQLNDTHLFERSACAAIWPDGRSPALS